MTFQNKARLSILLGWSVCLVFCMYGGFFSLKEKYKDFVILHSLSHCYNLGLFTVVKNMSTFKWRMARVICFGC